MGVLLKNKESDAGAWLVLCGVCIFIGALLNSVMTGNTVNSQVADLTSELGSMNITNQNLQYRIDKLNNIISISNDAIKTKELVKSNYTNTNNYLGLKDSIERSGFEFKAGQECEWWVYRGSDQEKSCINYRPNQKLYNIELGLWIDEISPKMASLEANNTIISYKYNALVNALANSSICG